MAKKKDTLASPTTIVPLYNSKAIADVVGDIVEGTTKLSIPLDGQPRSLTDANKLAYCLLEHALYDMTPWEVSFCGSIVKAGSLSDKQRNVVKKLAATYLGIDIDAETVTQSSKKPQ